MLVNRDFIEMSFESDINKATASNRSKMERQVTYLRSLLENTTFEYCDVMVTEEGHINVGTLVECILKNVYNGELQPAYSKKGLKDLSLRYTDENGKKHIKSYEVKTILYNESSNVQSNRLDLLIVSYDGIHVLSRSKYNTLKKYKEYFKTDTNNPDNRRLKRTIISQCEVFK